MKEYEPLIRRLLLRFDADGNPAAITARLAQAANRLKELRIPRELAIGVLARSLCLESARRPPPPPVPGQLAADLQDSLAQLPAPDRLLFALRFMDRRPLAQLGGAAPLRRIIRSVTRSLDLDRAPCPSDFELFGAHGNLLDAAELARVEPHVEGCSDCGERARQIREAIDQLKLARAPECPDPIDLLTGIGSDTSIAHLAECTDCRLKVEEVPFRRRSRLVLWGSFGIALCAAGAGIALLLLISKQTPRPSASVEEIRGELRRYRHGKWMDMPTDARIFDGDTLRWADSFSEALIRLPDGSELAISGPAEVEFQLGPDANRIRVNSGVLSFKAGSNVSFRVDPHLIRPLEVSLGRLHVASDSTRVSVYRGGVFAAHTSGAKLIDADQEAILYSSGTIAGPWTALSRPREVVKRWPAAGEDLQSLDFEDLPEGAFPDGWTWPRGEAGGVERAGTNRFFGFADAGGGPALFGAITGRRFAVQADMRSGPGGRLLIGIQNNFGHALEIGPDHVRLLRIRWAVAPGGGGRFQTFESPLAQSTPGTIRPGEWYGVSLEALEGVPGRTLRARWWPLSNPGNIAELEAVDRGFRTGTFAQAQAGLWSQPGAALAVDNLFWR